MSKTTIAETIRCSIIITIHYVKPKLHINWHYQLQKHNSLIRIQVDYHMQKQNPFSARIHRSTLSRNFIAVYVTSLDDFFTFSAFFFSKSHKYTFFISTTKPQKYQKFIEVSEIHKHYQLFYALTWMEMVKNDVSDLVAWNLVAQSLSLDRDGRRWLPEVQLSSCNDGDPALSFPKNFREFPSSKTILWVKW